jgi:putative aldouronate transport system substrate-binding protein
MKKLLSVMLAVMLVLSVASFAGAEGELSEPGVLPIWTGSEPYVIHVLLAENPKVSDFDDNYYTHWIEDNCNVDLQFSYLPATEGKEKLVAMIAGGSIEDEGIDVINVGGVSMADVKSWGDEGIILDVSEYYANGLAVNADAAVAAYPELNLIKSITTAEGAIYSVPKIQISPSNETRFKMWVNEQWLKNLNLEVPTTIDEFYNMLVAFKEQDANGDGDATNEIPFITSTGFGGTPYKFLTNAFVFESVDDDMFLLKDGHVTTSYLQDEWLEAQTFLKKLCDEGLLAPESFTYNNDDLKAVACSEDDIVGAVTNSSCAFMGQRDDPIRLRYICVNPLEGPNGVKFASYAASTTSNMWIVTANATNPELIFRVGDFQFSEEGFLLGRFGLENENWMTKENYMAAHPEQTLAARYEVMGYEGKYVFYNDIRDQTVNNLNWYDPMAYFAGDVESEGMYVADDGNGKLINLETDATCRQETASGYYQLCKPGLDTYVPTLAYTEEELEVLAEYQANIRTYVKEQRTKYIIGDESDLANKDAFIQNLKDTFGLDELLEVVDAAYQRQYGSN